MATSNIRQIAVVGAGIAGATAAHALSLAGHSVQVFDKSRGAGGRLATRRLEWTDRFDRTWTTRFDHGAIAVTTRSDAFRTFMERALPQGGLAEWLPTLAGDSLPLETGERLLMPVPDMPELCRRLLQGAARTWSFAVDGLHRTAHGWQLQSGDVHHDARFDAVVLAIPPAQAAPLLSPHRRDWARHASLVAMQPCWTLMGVSDAPQPALNWDLAQPPRGPLACVLRSDARPGRQRVPGQAHWVVHARAGWSRSHLEQPAAWVQQQMQAALADHLGQTLDWQHCTVHRWRYALPQVPGPASDDSCWWDLTQGLGVCGDFLGGAGAEGAWASAQSLAQCIGRG